jgi:hypothetical protein
MGWHVSLGCPIFPDDSRTVSAIIGKVKRMYELTEVSLMTTGFIVALIVVFVIFIGSTIWATNKAYRRKPDTIDPIQTNKEWEQ